MQYEQDYPLTHRDRLKLALYLFIAALTVLVASCSGCSAMLPSSDTAAPTKTPDIIDAEYARLVRITVDCKYGSGAADRSGGSGVRVGGTIVLTAKHVVTCKRDVAPGITELGDVTSITVMSRDKPKVQYAATLEGETSTDIARLDVKGMPATTPVQVGQTFLGERLCAVFASPMLGRRCGELWPSTEGTGGLLIDFVAEHGNSGSGLYDQSGDLVGIVVWLHWCMGTESNGQVCTAGATPLAPRPWIAAP